MSEPRVQWYPGHMARARRKLTEALGMVDVVCELLDARIPHSSRNPDIGKLLAGKPRVIILNRADQADPSLTQKWQAALSRDAEVICTDARSGRGVDGFAGAVRAAGVRRLEQLAAAGRNDKLRAMIVGVPNVGKSSLINRIAGGTRAKTEDRPGVTRTNQWFYVDGGLELLDTPGILWPKFDDERVGLNLAYVGSVRDEVVDTEGLAASLAARLAGIAPDLLEARYKVDITTVKENAMELPDGSTTLGGELLEAIGRKRGCLISGGEVDITRAATMFLDEFRGGVIGRITLEVPEC